MSALPLVHYYSGDDNLEAELLDFDTASTSFEIESGTLDEDESEGPRRNERPSTLRLHGHSNDHRSDPPQVVIGLAVTRDGIPVRCWVWPENTAVMSVVEQVKKDLTRCKLGRVITVVDRGLASEENLRIIQRAGGHYIAGEKLRAGKPDVIEALGRGGRYQQVKTKLRGKEIVVGDGEPWRRQVLVYNPERAERDRLRREKLVEHLEAMLTQLETMPSGQHTKAVWALLSHPTYSRLLVQTSGGKLRMDRTRLRDEERLDGKYLLCTFDDTLPAQDAALGYKQ